MAGCNVYMVTVPTPETKGERPSHRASRSACEAVGLFLREVAPRVNLCFPVHFTHGRDRQGGGRNSFAWSLLGT
jgi:hypothetical protein